MKLIWGIAALMLASNGAIAQSIPVPVPRPGPGVAVETPKESDKDLRKIYQAACPALLQGEVKGRVIEPLSEGQCGERSPVEIEAIGSIRFTEPARMNCLMASTLVTLIKRADGLADEHLDSPLAEIETGPGYQCRRRNRRADGKLSEHAFANAIDVMGFVLTDGRKIAVESDWQQGLDARSDTTSRPATPAGRFLAAFHAGACQLFTTVLSPESGESHRSHIHLDLGCHGRSCTFKICQ